MGKFTRREKLKQLKCLFFLRLGNLLPLQAHRRYILVKWAGVNIIGKPRIYKNVDFDNTHPELITIEDDVSLTQGVTILTHYRDTSKPGRHFRFGEVKIEKGAMIGVNSIICNSVTIGRGSIVGAGSVVTKDIPPYQVWAGNPARYIKDCVR